MSADGFRALCAGAGVVPTLTDVDGSSLFCDIHLDG
jgi:hypothetical protein